MILVPLSKMPHKYTLQLFSDVLVFVKLATKRKQRCSVLSCLY